jgi:hypothetical protein
LRKRFRHALHTKTKDLFADNVTGRVVKALNERETKRKKI